MPRRPQGQQQLAPVTTRQKRRSVEAKRAAPEQAEVRIVLDPNETIQHPRNPLAAGFDELRRYETQ
jgi:hypothetical protein